MEYGQLKNNLDKIDYEMKRLMGLGKDIKRENALIPEKNKAEVMKYEPSLMQHNRNRLNLQQQPHESELEYYKRLKEIEKQKYGPILYKQYSVNKATKELKTNLGNLFKDESTIENILKSLNDNDKVILNKNFSVVENDFIKKTRI
jgi:hypothetical protein